VSLYENNKELRPQVRLAKARLAGKDDAGAEEPGSDAKAQPAE
jgi:hypothetical protein